MTINAMNVQIGDLVCGYGQIVKNVEIIGSGQAIVITFEDGTETTSCKAWDITVIRTAR